MECVAHVIARACKADVVGVQSEDGPLDTSITREKINKAVTWNKKSQKGAVDFIQAQKHCKLANVSLLALVKTIFSYILHSFKSLLVNKDEI